MVTISSKINELYFLVYPLTDDLPFYINNLVELMAFTGMPKKKLVFKINHSKSNVIYCNLNNKRYSIYYFLAN